jgi:RHS repeat-associated protein
MTSAAEVSVKRYRYTGTERDEETGLSYHGARYYALWLGRWVSVDPAGLNGGQNLYAYGGDNPVRNSDKGGSQPNDQTKPRITLTPQIEWQSVESGALSQPAQQWSVSKDQILQAQFQAAKKSNENIQQREALAPAPLSQIASEGEAALKNWGRQVLIGTGGAYLVYGSKDPKLIAAYEEQMRKQDLALLTGSLEKATMTSPANAPSPKDTPIDRPSDVRHALDFALTVGPLAAGRPSGAVATELGLEAGGATLGAEEELAGPLVQSATPSTVQQVTTTNAQLQSLANAADQPIIWLAGDEAMLNAHRQVMSTNPTVWFAAPADAASGVVGYRNAMGTVPVATPSGAAPLMGGLEFHHFSYPRAAYPNLLMEPENIFVSFKSTHTQIHSAFGGTQAMRWAGIQGAETPIRNMFTFWINSSTGVH